MAKPIQDLLAEKALQAEENLARMLEDRLVKPLLEGDGEIRRRLEDLERKVALVGEGQGALREELSERFGQTEKSFETASADRAGLKLGLECLPGPLIQRVDGLRKELAVLQADLLSAVKRLDALGRGSDRLKTAQNELIETTGRFSQALASEYPKIEHFSAEMASLQRLVLESEQRLRRRFLVFGLSASLVALVCFVVLVLK